MIITTHLSLWWPPLLSLRMFPRCWKLDTCTLRHHVPPRVWWSMWTSSWRNIIKLEQCNCNIKIFSYFLVSIWAEWGVSSAPSLYQAMAGAGTALLVTLHLILRSEPELNFFVRGVFSWALLTANKIGNVIDDLMLDVNTPVKLDQKLILKNAW